MDKTFVKSLYIDTKDCELLPITVLGDYRKNGASGVIDVGCFSSEEIEEITTATIKANNLRWDSWKNNSLLSDNKAQGPACSCLIKKLDNGTVIMGRNMDLSINFSPVVIFRTKGNGKNTYDTVNLSYSAPGPITFDQIVELGAIPKNIFKRYVVGTCDALNCEGLYLEVNMREPLDCQNDSTNPNSNLRVVSFHLVRLLADHCRTIKDALEYVKTLDIYDPNTNLFNWSMAIGMMDKTGRYGVLELVNNKIIWNEGRDGFACGQANFYWAKEAENVRFGSGIGRWRKMMEYYYDIANQNDIANVMKVIRYSNYFTDGSLAKDWNVDWISEVNDKIPYFMKSRLEMMSDWKENYGIKFDEKHFALITKLVEKEKQQGGPVWSYEYLRKPENYYDAVTFMDFFIKCHRQLPNYAQKLTGYMECSTISYSANNKKLELTSNFYEMNDIYHIGLNKTTIERIPTKTKFGNI